MKQRILLLETAFALQGRMALAELITWQELVDWAIAALVVGYDSPSLVILAGLSDLDSLEEVRGYWHKSLTELDLYLPNHPEEAIAYYARLICRQIIQEQITAAAGHQILYQIWLTTSYSQNWNSQNYTIWMYLEDSLELVEIGYGVLLPQFEGLNRQTYDYFVKQAATNFLSQDFN